MDYAKKPQRCGFFFFTLVSPASVMHFFIDPVDVKACALGVETARAAKLKKSLTSPSYHQSNFTTFTHRCGS
jgi:hypothetical protein